MTKTATAGGLGSGVLTVWLLGQFGVDVPGEVAAAIAGTLMPIVMWAENMLGALGNRCLNKVKT